MRYLIIGGTGSLGKKLIQRLGKSSEKKGSVAVYSRDEAKHWTLKNEGYISHFFVGDIRDTPRLKEAIQQFKPNVIIIAAALKQVDTCELSPNESVKTNLQGTQNVIQAIDELTGEAVTKLHTVLFVSTDKACSPVNVYGMCKAISERLVTSKAAHNKSINYLAVRYGNVLESRGSIIPLFKFQVENQEFITVTDPDMTRFVMTLDNAVDLIQHTIENGKSGEIWVPKLPSMRIGDLAEIFSEIYKKPIKIIGHRPGEKLHEDIINLSESIRTRVGDAYIVIRPAFETGYYGDQYSYSSNDNVLTKNELYSHLKSLGIFDMSLDDFVGSKIEHIVGKQ